MGRQSTAPKERRRSDARRRVRPSCRARAWAGTETERGDGDGDEAGRYKSRWVKVSRRQ